MNIVAYGPYNIDLDMIVDLSDNSEYWVKVESFLNDIDGKDFKKLSPPQQNWLKKIASEYEQQHEKLEG